MEELIQECDPKVRRAVCDSIQCLKEQIEDDWVEDGIKPEDIQKVTSILITLLLLGLESEKD